MTITTFTAPLPNGQLAKRSSKTMTYTHAVVSQVSAHSFHTSLELARRAHRAYGAKMGAMRIVPVTAEVKAPVKTAANERNATARGQITRTINIRKKYISSCEARLAQLQAGGGQLGYWVKTWGEAKAQELQAREISDCEKGVAWAQGQIAKLEEERAALLAAQVLTTLPTDRPVGTIEITAETWRDGRVDHDTLDALDMLPAPRSLGAAATPHDLLQPLTWEAQEKMDGAGVYRASLGLIDGVEYAAEVWRDAPGAWRYQLLNLTKDTSLPAWVTYRTRFDAQRAAADYAMWRRQTGKKVMVAVRLSWMGDRQSFLFCSGYPVEPENIAQEIAAKPVAGSWQALLEEYETLALQLGDGDAAISHQRNAHDIREMGDIGGEALWQQQARGNLQGNVVACRLILQRRADAAAGLTIKTEHMQEPARRDSREQLERALAHLNHRYAQTIGHNRRDRIRGEMQQLTAALGKLPLAASQEPAQASAGSAAISPRPRSLGAAATPPEDAREPTDVEIPGSTFHVAVICEGEISITHFPTASEAMAFAILRPEFRGVEQVTAYMSRPDMVPHRLWSWEREA